MPTLQNDRKYRIRRNLPVKFRSLLLYPITMDVYDEYLELKNVLTTRLGSLPVKYQCMNYLDAMFAIDLDNQIANGTTLGFFERCLRFLAYALRITYDPKQFITKVKMKQENNNIVLSHITIEQDGNTEEITSTDFAFTIRQILAEQNGFELPSETDNLELVQSYEQKKALSSKAQELHINLDDLVASVAYNAKLPLNAIYDMTVREFELLHRAIDRDKRYMLYNQAELSGMVSFKHGNPAPSWTYDAVDNSLGTVSLSDIQSNNPSINLQT